MKKRLLGVLLATATFFSAQAQNVRVYGYFPQYRSTTGIQFDKLTDIAYSFINTDANGNLKTSGYSGDAVFGFDITKFTIIKDGAANAGTNLWIALGGADDAHARDNRLNSVSADATKRGRLATQLVQFCVDNGVYGISVDWEFPDPGTEVANHVKLIEELTSEIAASSNSNIKIGVAVGGEYKGSANHLNYIHTDLFNSKANLVDEWHVMAYDFPASYNVNHSSLADAEGSMDGWNGKGMDYSKMLLGVPFYGRNANRSGEIEYNNLGGSAATNFTSDNNSSGWYYNGKTTLEDKIDLAVEKGSEGILIWDLGQDESGTYSLLNAINDKVNTVCPIAKPNLGADKGVCAGNSVTLDPGVTGSGLEYTWTLDGGSSIGSNATLDVNTAGTYIVSITDGGCTKTDEIIIVSGSSITTTGANGCDDEELTLTVNSPASGKSYKWYDQESSGELLHTGNTYAETFASTTTVYVEEASSGVVEYTTSPAVVPDGKNHAWAGTEWTFRTAQLLVAETDLKVKSLRIIASKESGITFNVKVIDASNAPNYTAVAEVGPFTSSADGSAATWEYVPFDFDVNLELNSGEYFIYIEPVSGDEANYGFVNSYNLENSEVGTYTLKAGMHQATKIENGFPNFSPTDMGAAYGPFLNWKIETGANASCGRTAATASVVNCGPPDVIIVSPKNTETYVNTEVIDFEATATDGGAVTSVVFEVYKGFTKVATIPTTKDGTTYTGTWTPTQSGDDYEFKVIATDDDSNESEAFMDFDVDLDVSTKDAILSNSVNVYPSPATDNFNVAFDLGKNSNVEILILNAVGALVDTQTLSNQIGTQLVNISTREFNNGLYYVKVKAGNNVITKTINVIK